MKSRSFIGFGLLVLVVAVLFLPQANAVVPVTVNGVLEITPTHYLLHGSAGAYTLFFSIAPPLSMSMNWFHVEGNFDGKHDLCGYVGDR